MLLLLRRPYPVLAAVLGAISNVVFLIVGFVTGSSTTIVLGVLFGVLSVVQITRNLRRTPAGKRS
jgi:hypothetical protein